MNTGTNPFLTLAVNALDRLTQPLHGELDIRRLQIAPASAAAMGVFAVEIEHPLDLAEVPML